MVRVKNGIVIAFVAVLLCNSHYNHDDVGMVAAAAVSGGREAEADDGSTRVVPVPTQKLNKSNKASKPHADKDVERLLRLLVFTTAMDVYCSMQPPPSLEAAAVSRAGNNSDEREFETARGALR